MGNKATFANIFLIAQLVLFAAGLTGCANQTHADEQLSLTLDKASRSRIFSMAAGRPFASRKSARSFGERGGSKPEPEIVTGSIGAQIPDIAKANDMREPEPAPETGVPVASPDQRTLRAMNCRELMLKEHPTAHFMETGSAAAQRNFFSSCMKQAADLR